MARRGIVGPRCATRPPLASLGVFALQCEAVDDCLQEACRLAALAVGGEVAAVLQLQPAPDQSRTLRLRAGIGWQPGPIGETSFKAGPRTAEGITLDTAKPTIIADTDAEPAFSASPLLAIDGVRAVVNAAIPGSFGQAPFGLLQAGSRSPRRFGEGEVAFLHEFAALIGVAVQRLGQIDEAREADRQWELTMDAGKIGRWEFDLASGVASGTARARQIFGYTGHPADWRYDQLLEQVLPEDRAAVITAFRAAADSGGDWSFQCRVRRSATSQIRWIEARGRTRGRRGETLPTHLLGLVTDTSATKSAETALRRTNEAYEAKVTERTRQLTEVNGQMLLLTDRHERVETTFRRSHKMEAIGQLAEGMAHDFNNLLAGISGSLELIRVRAAQGRTSELDRYIEAALEAANRGAALSHRLLAFSRRETPVPRASDINHLLSSMEPLLRHRCNQGIRLRLCLGKNLDAAWCDPNELDAAVLDLVSAACDTMPGGGAITISTANTSLPGAGGCVSLSVVDDGPQTGRLPLPQAVVDAVARAGGHLRQQSYAPGEATVTVLLPCHLAAPPAIDPARPLPPGLVVLVVEDEPAVRMVVAEVLADMGYQVLEAADGRAGLNLAEAATRLDLLITGFGLPGEIDGRHLASLVRRKRPGLKVLFITGSAEPQAAEDSMQVMTKPFAMEALTQRVHEIMAG